VSRLSRHFTSSAPSGGGLVESRKQTVMDDCLHPATTQRLIRMSANALAATSGVVSNGLLRYMVALLCKAVKHNSANLSEKLTGLEFLDWIIRFAFGDHLYELAAVIGSR